MSKFRIDVRRPSPAMVVALLALVVAASGVAVAAIPNSSTGEIHGCYSQRNGALRVIDTQASPDETCNATKELDVSWSKQGPKGDQGIQGIQGLTGGTGPAGPSFVGSPCASEDGTYDGTVRMGVNGTNGDIILTCVNPPGGGGGGGGGTPIVCDDNNSYTIDSFNTPTSSCEFMVDLNNADRDGDEYVATQAFGDDCDDNNATVYPGAPEIADGLDNDCDGALGSQSAYSGPPGTEGVGVCVAGTQNETATGTWSGTNGEVVPTTEIAGNDLDDDCDREVDEGT